MSIGLLVYTFRRLPGILDLAFLTIFSAPKPFSNPHIAAIQRNAIQSWLHLDETGKDVDIILVGQEDGMVEVAAEFGIQHLPDVACNQEGTPLVSSIFSLARAASQGTLLAYLNADIITLPDFLSTCRQVSDQAKQFLVVGQRWNLELTQDWDFGPGWDQRLRDELTTRGHLHPPAGSDYFIFPKDLFIDIPNFAIGRAGWDNWMIYHALQGGWLVIDATPSIQIIHQNHDYGHLPDGKPHYDLKESDHNIDLAGGLLHMYTVLDTNRELVDGKLRSPRPGMLRALRKMEVWLTPKDGRRSGIRWGLARTFRRMRRVREKPHKAIPKRRNRPPKIHDTNRD